jgi:hypothetical protein
MKKQPYKRKPGDIEIRILKNGSIVSLTPDEIFTEIIHGINKKDIVLDLETERRENAATEPEQTN